MSFSGYIVGLAIGNLLFYYAMAATPAATVVWTLLFLAVGVPLSAGLSSICFDLRRWHRRRL